MKAADIVFSAVVNICLGASLIGGVIWLQVMQRDKNKKHK